MNLYSIWQRVNRRLPGYDPTELYDEINDAYQEVWDTIIKLDDSYFTDIKVVTVGTQATEFDFLYNSNGNLTSTVSNRYFQIDRIRILQPNNTQWIPALPRNWNDPEYLSYIQTTPQVAATDGSYRYIPFANGAVQFMKPLPVEVQIEVVYTFVFLPLTLVSNGTVSSSGTSVLGATTTFTQLLGADYQGGFAGGTPVPITPIQLHDSGAGVWLVGVTDGGILTTTLSSGSTGTLFLNDIAGNSWQVTVTTGGLLVTTSVAVVNYPLFVAMASPSFTWNLGITTGGILTTTLTSPLLSVDEDTSVGIELVLPGNQTYRVKQVLSDTTLTTINPITPTISAAGYTLAMVPDIPQGHHDVIATVATRNVMARPGTDPQLPYWTQRASQQLDAMRDSIMTRQRQEPPRRRRFSQSVLRYFVPTVSR